jgi:hypothetical protein
MRTWIASHASNAHGVWVCGLAFSILAALLKAVFFPQFDPPVLWHMLTAFLVAALLWKWLVTRGDKVTSVWGGSVGALIGLLAPPFTWLLYGVYLFFTAAEPAEALGWSLAYAWVMLMRVSPFSALLGILIGAGIAYAQQARLR